MEKQIEGYWSCMACNTSSENRFVAPMTLVGLTALSVETNMNVSTFASTAALAVCRVPKMLL